MFEKIEYNISKVMQAKTNYQHETIYFSDLDLAQINQILQYTKATMREKYIY